MYIEKLFEKETGKNKSDLLNDFLIFTGYLGRKKIVLDSKAYANDFAAFLLHAHHVSPYDLILPCCKDKEILEIGCFLGYGTSRIAKSANKVIAIDSDEDALGFAREHRAGANIVFQKSDARRLPFPDNSFDILIAFQLIEHIPPREVGNFLADSKRVLKKHGLLFILTPNRKFRLLPFQRPFNPEHYQEFTAKKLVKVLETYFDDVEIKGLRAKEWIEEIERRRVRRSYPVYIKGVIYDLLPCAVKSMLSKPHSQSARPENLDDGLFEGLFQKFSVSDFFLDGREVDKAMDIMAICKK